MRPPAHLAEKPYLRPVYDEPAFIVRNLCRCFGGWYSGVPSGLKPAPRKKLASEVVALAGGMDRLPARAAEHLATGDAQEAARFVDWAVDADASNKAAHTMRAKVYEHLLGTSTSTMSKGIYGAAARESAEKAGTGVKM